VPHAVRPNSEGVPGSRITIDLDVAGERDWPRGRVLDENTGDTRDFLGWLALVAALDALISNTGSHNSKPRADRHEGLPG
jgi:hypothetical protein